MIPTGSLSARRAWIEINNVETAAKASLSLSARRAWIEIRVRWTLPDTWPVALRKESVDRNCDRPYFQTVQHAVALRKESVDRNQNHQIPVEGICCRSPQGERG